jgi:hypothetical protein
MRERAREKELVVHVKCLVVSHTHLVEFQSNIITNISHNSRKEKEKKANITYLNR